LNLLGKILDDFISTREVSLNAVYGDFDEYIEFGRVEIAQDYHSGELQLVIHFHAHGRPNRDMHEIHRLLPLLTDVANKAITEARFSHL